MKWLKGMILITAMAVFTLGPRAAAAQEVAPQDTAAQEGAAQEPDGQGLYDQHCKKCHGPAGGEPSAAMVKKMEDLTSITDPAFLAETPDDSLISVTEEGRGKMKPFAEKLTKEEIVAIVNFLRTFEAAADEEESP